jgi:dienelactone hydrolase
MDSCILRWHPAGFNESHEPVDAAIDVERASSASQLRSERELMIESHFGRVALLLVVSMLPVSCCSSLSSLVDPARVVAPHPVSLGNPSRTFSVFESSVVWHDAKRNRDVPVKCYVPGGLDAPPVVIFSHGIGEDRDSYAWLGRALAQRGYVAIHVTHFGTDKSVLKQGYLKLYRATKEKSNWLNRPLDVSFLIDQLAAHAEGAPKVDLDRIAVAGHSAGAFTVMALAGFTFNEGSLADHRVRTGVAMSMPKMNGIVPGHGYDSLAVPILNMTGTCDSSLIYRTRPRDRRVPFDSTTARNQYLITFEGVNHDTFSNDEDGNHEMIAAITASWLDAFLRGEASSREWFDQGGVSASYGGKLAQEKK